MQRLVLVRDWSTPLCVPLTRVTSLVVLSTSPRNSSSARKIAARRSVSGSKTSLPTLRTLARTWRRSCLVVHFSATSNCPQHCLMAERPSSATPLLATLRWPPFVMTLRLAASGCGQSSPATPNSAYARCVTAVRSPPVRQSNLVKRLALSQPSRLVSQAPS